MDRIQYQTASIITGTTTTTQVFVDRYDQIQVLIPTFTGVMGSSPIAITLKGSPASGVTAQPVFFYDYVNKTPATSVITVASAGYYEVPYAGAANFLSVQMDVAATGATNIYIIAPKITY